MQFIILHGSFGSPKGNWFPYLGQELQKLGQDIITPTFPVEDYDETVKKGANYHSQIQTLTTWFQAFEEQVVPYIKTEEKVCFAGHSISAVFILHCVEQFNLQLDSAIFVSPFLEKLERPEYNAVNETFYKSDFDFEKLKTQIPVSYTLYSDNDQYVQKDQPKKFAEKTHSQQIIIPRGQHLGSNVKEFPLILELCKTRFFYE